ncbi:MAG: MFS transporter [Puniceicoccales bacterium]|nr:MFS transporter [Puniceicoccales bacterium]
MGTDKTRKKFFYGWIIVIGMMFAFGSAQVIGANALNLYYGFYGQEFGIGPAELGVISGMVFWVQFIFAVAAGVLIDRIGVRWVLFIGAVLFVVSQLLTTLVANNFIQILAFALLAGVASAFIGVMTLQVLARRWFFKSAGLASGLIYCTTGIFQGIFFPLLAQLAVVNGWRMTWTVQTIITAAVFVVAILITRESPREMGLNPDGVSDEEFKKTFEAMGDTDEMPYMTRKEALKSRQFWAFSILVGFVTFADFGVIMNVTPIAMSVGIQATVAAGAMSFYAFATVIGQIVLGYLGDRYGRVRIIKIVVLFLAAVFLFAFFFVKNDVSLYVFLIVSGLAMSVCFVYNGPLMGDMFGVKYLGSINGVSLLVGGVIGGIGIMTAGLIAGATGSYHDFFLVGIILYVIAFLLALLLKPTKVQIACAKGKKSGEMKINA